MRGDSNERLTILSEAEKTALYGIPDFDDFQRVEFFAMTDAERSLALRRRGIVKQVYCLLQIGYFKAKLTNPGRWNTLTGAMRTQRGQA